jgi:hypothetical protein
MSKWYIVDGDKEVRYMVCVVKRELEYENKPYEVEVPYLITLLVGKLVLNVIVELVGLFGVATTLLITAYFEWAIVVVVVVPL